jgi:quercetin dioxygenase-like cupin family protein
VTGEIGSGEPGVVGPQLLGDFAGALAGQSPDDTNRALWTLPVANRQLDANLIRLAPGDRIDPHDGPDLDVLMVVVAGSGTVSGAQENPERPEGLVVRAGSLVWLPRRSRRGIHAGDDGLAYLTVHPRRPALQIGRV